MKLLSVNVSLPKEVTFKGKTVRTGIFKTPVEGRLKVGHLNQNNPTPTRVSHPTTSTIRWTSA